MADELILDYEDLYLLHRHYINLTCIDSGVAAIKENGGKPKRYNFSAFVVNVEGVALAITAGHIFSDLKQAITAGAKLSDWAIDDSMTSDHGFPAYPIDVNLERDVVFFDEDGLDYGAYLLDPMALRALNQSGIVPIEEAQWNAEDLPDFPFWTLIGLPTQFATLRHAGPSIKNHVTVHVTSLHDRPTGLKDMKHPRLFARVEFESVAEWGRHFDIGGMSGGPIFGTRTPPQGSSYDYRLIGIQSSWDERENVAMCAAQPFLRALVGLVRSVHGCGGKSTE
ncbi:MULTISPECIES: hypothetical protein [Aquitalea]|uniref:Trypsin-like peptidase n=1 Tax=Aquitalea magnusonii TaxID=332411 RepID=A0A318IV13_9NEIS|nr:MULTISPECIES: hypothetical protein [Aquitalea]PXX38863.1 hypothetical protein DFR38_13111 [Aquitalea magnusonii]